MDVAQSGIGIQWIGGGSEPPRSHAQVGREIFGAQLILLKLWMRSGGSEPERSHAQAERGISPVDLILRILGVVILQHPPTSPRQLEHEMFVVPKNNYRDRHFEFCDSVGVLQNADLYGLDFGAANISCSGWRGDAGAHHCTCEPCIVLSDPGALLHRAGQVGG